MKLNKDNQNNAIGKMNGLAECPSGGFLSSAESKGIKREMPGLLKYQEIQNYLLQELSSGRFAIGDKFYSETEIKNKFGVTQITVRQACVMLIEQGYLRKKRGSGTFVTDLPRHPVRLKMVRRCVIVVMISENGLENNSKIGRLLLEIHRAADAAGYLVMLSYGNFSALEDIGMDGVIVINRQSPESLRQLCSSGVPAVAVQDTGVPTIPFLKLDYAGAAVDVVRTLAASGHKRLLFFGVGGDAEAVRNSLSEYLRSACERKQLEYLEVIAPDSTDAGRAVDAAFGSGSRPDAVLVANHWSLPLLHQILTRHRLRFPDDISIVVHGSNAQMVPAITPYSCFDFELHDGADKLVNMLRMLIRGEKSPDCQPCCFRLSQTPSIMKRD